MLFALIGGAMEATEGGNEGRVGASLKGWVKDRVEGQSPR